MYPKLDDSAALNTLLCNRLATPEDDLGSHGYHYPGSGVFFESETGERCLWRESKWLLFDSLV